MFGKEKKIPPVPEPGSNPGTSPEFTAPFLSKITFMWVQRIMSIGAKRPLEQEDLWVLTSHRQASPLSEKFRLNWKREMDWAFADPKNPQTPKLWRALNRTFFWRFWSAGALKVVGDTLQTTQPLVVKAIITFVTDSLSDSAKGVEAPPIWHGILLAIGLFLMGLLSTLCMHQFWQGTMGTGIGARTVLITTIYRKGLVLSAKAKQDFSTGKVTNIMSTDTTRLDFLAGYWHILWTAPLMLLLILCLLLTNLGVSALAGFAFLCLFVPIQGRFVTSLAAIRRKSTAVTDLRVRLTNEVLQGMRVVKFFGWEDAFLNRLDEIRLTELKYVRYLLISRSAVSAVALTVPSFAAILSFVAYSLSGHPLNAAVVFSSLSLFNIMRMPLMMFPQVVSAWVDAKVSLARITELLSADELQEMPGIDVEAKYALAINNGEFQWEVPMPTMTAAETKAKEKSDKAKGKEAKKEGKKKAIQDKANKKKQAKLDRKLHQSTTGGSTSGSPSPSPEPVSFKQQLDDEKAELERQDRIRDDSDNKSVASSILQEKMLARLSENDPTLDTESMLDVSKEEVIATVDGGDEEVEIQDLEAIVTSAEAQSSSTIESSEKSTFGLKNINLAIPRGQLVAVVGAVGSGKSSLLNAIVGEMRKTSGQLVFGSSIGYCPQTAWIQNATLRDNVTFGLPYDEVKYRQVIKDCALERDLEILPEGDQTEIGERGVNLSGGQKQRVNIARAVYFGADTVLLDDPLSAVDPHVGKYLFRHCIQGALQDKTRILVTHQLHVLPKVDYVICMKDGEIVERGTFAELMENEGEFSLLMKAYGGMEDDKGLDEDDDSLLGASTQDGEDDIAGASIPGVTSKALSVKGEKDTKPEGKKTKGLMTTEERSTGSVDGRIYKAYLKAAGSIWIFPVILILLILGQVCKVGNDLWLSWWTDDQFKKDSTFYMVIYACWGLAQGFFGFVTGIFFSIAGAHAAKVLHTQAVANVFRAPTSYFDTTPLGRIINRFSKDVDAVDNLLSESYRMFTGTFAIVFSTFILIAVIFPWFMVPLVPLLIFYYFAAVYYRSTSRELKRIDSILRSSLYAHFSETLSGLATVRAYRVQPRFLDKNEFYLDQENRAYILSVTVQRWLGVRLETIANTLVLCTSIFGVCSRYTVPPGTIGLVLSYSMSVTGTFNWCVRQYAEVENNMNAVERLHHYAKDLEVEAPAYIPETKPEESWPQSGSISIRNLELRYRPDLPAVLHDLSIDIKGGEKIGIVGRTGAGKSSIMVALFRFVEASKGSIEIDGVDISKIGLHDLRTSLAIIPQDPVLFSGTIRSNLDPFSKKTDQELWDALERAELKTYVMSVTGQLDSQVSEFGENLSVGQRQMLCLARALLTSAKILLLDEATSSIDVESDMLLQKAIRVDFKHSTTITIAHRINTIVDYERVLVLDAGKLVEFDTPHNLLSDPNSVFSSMADETGPTNAAMLREIAKNVAMGQKVEVHEILAEVEKEDVEGYQV